MEISISDVLSGFWQNCIGRILGVRTCANACVRTNTCVCAHKNTQYGVCTSIRAHTGVDGVSQYESSFTVVCFINVAFTSLDMTTWSSELTTWGRDSDRTGLVDQENRYVNYMRTRIATGMVVVGNFTRSSCHYGFYSQIRWKSHIGVSVIIS